MLPNKFFFRTKEEEEEFFKYENMYYFFILSHMRYSKSSLTDIWYSQSVIQIVSWNELNVVAFRILQMFVNLLSKCFQEMRRIEI